MTRWTPALLDEVRGYARAGYTMRQTSAALGLHLTSLVTQASRQKIKFNGRRRPGSTVSERATSRQALDRDIEAARLEAGFGATPQYRGEGR